LIACAGLQSDRIARIAGLQVDLRIIPFRGEYFQLPPEKSGVVRHLIYPVPDPTLPFLGVHLTRKIDGHVTVGPNAVLGFAREGYGHFSFNLRDTAETLSFPGFWRVIRNHWRSALSELRGSALRRRYLQECRKYCPELQLQDLLPYQAGIRAQAVMRDGTLAYDFLFADTPRTVHVLNAPSPAATAAMPIARMIVARALHEIPAAAAVAR
jgi:L-2-hydroxyglutarate oxidase